VSQRASLGAGTSYALGQVSVYEFPISVLGPGALDRWIQSDDNEDMRSGVPS
jgi:hypothetical protein